MATDSLTFLSRTFTSETTATEDIECPVAVVSLLFMPCKHGYGERPQNVCFFIDPPYLSTDAATYTNYWRLKDYLDVLHTLKDTNYFYFTSNKSSIVELCDWLEHNYDACNPFAGAVRRETASRMNYNSTYTDIMLFKHQ